MKTETAEIRKKMRNSLELVCLRQYSAVYIIITGFAGVVSILFSGYAKELSVWAVAGGVLLVFWMPVLILWLWRSFVVYRKVDGYTFYRTKLTQPHPSRFFRSMYFTVLLEKPDGEKFIVNTNAIFPTHGFNAPTVDSYLNKTVTVAHNEETGIVVVIG